MKDQVLCQKLCLQNPGDWNTEWVAEGFKGKWTMHQLALGKKAGILTCGDCRAMWISTPESNVPKGPDGCSFWLPVHRHSWPCNLQQGEGHAETRQDGDRESGEENHFGQPEESTGVTERQSHSGWRLHRPVGINSGAMLPPATRDFWQCLEIFWLSLLHLSKGGI